MLDLYLGIMKISYAKSTSGQFELEAHLDIIIDIQATVVLGDGMDFSLRQDGAALRDGIVSSRLVFRTDLKPRPGGVARDLQASNRVDAISKD